MRLFSESFAGLAKLETVFLHGNLASGVWWRPTVSEWRKLGSLGDHELRTVDWRGCGRNPDCPSDTPFTLQNLADDVVETLELRTSERRIALVGHSLGGLIALQIMAQHPELVSRAVLLDPVGVRGVVFDESMYEAFRQMARNPELCRNVILSTIHETSKLEDELRLEIARDASKAVAGIGCSVLEILKTVDLSAAVSQIRIPTLILHGAHDKIIDPEDSRRTADLMSESRLEIIPDAGHCWNIENPQAFTQRIREFLN